MLSYQHAYHAGNHADVLKHILLGDIVSGLQNKDTPLFMLDAFASRGVYDLHGEQAQKTREFETGITKLWHLRHHALPSGVNRWFDCITAHNQTGDLQYFPGSTAILHHMKRQGDRLTACDLHPQEFDALRAAMQSHRGFNLQKIDAYEAIKASLPPKEKRGLIFLDPSYEVKEEYVTIAKAVVAAHHKFKSGVYVIWYPVLPAARHIELFKTLKHSGVRNIKHVELDCPTTFPDLQMTGSGLIIVNPPWHAEAAMAQSLAWINKNLCDNQACLTNQWLVSE